MRVTPVTDKIDVCVEPSPMIPPSFELMKVKIGLNNVVGGGGVSGVRRFDVVGSNGSSQQCHGKNNVYQYQCNQGVHSSYGVQTNAGT